MIPDSFLRSEFRLDGMTVAGALTSALLSLQFVGVAAAHGSSHAPDIPQSVPLLAVVAGLTILSVTIVFGRRQPQSDHRFILAGVLAGLAVTVAGSIGLIELSVIESLRNTTSPVPRNVYYPLSVVLGAGIAVISLGVGRYRWPTRPRYVGLGVLFGSWVAYPGFMASLVGQSAALGHPAGTALVSTLPIAVGYVLWRDASTVLRTVVADRTARWFGLSTALLVGILFLFSTGMLSIIPDEGVGLSWSQGYITTIPVANPLVYWPAVEFWFPHLPLSGYLSAGMSLMLGVLVTLVGLNAAVFAHQWRLSAADGMSGSASGAVAVAGPNACCCCGPVLAELAVIAVGPSAAAPLYWLFVDIASPVGSLFFVTSVALLLGTLIRTARTDSQG